MKRTIVLGAMAALTLFFVAAIIYMVKTDKRSLTAIEVERRDCGDVDALKGDKLGSCVELAVDLMGRENVPIDDDAARALLKRTCDQAYERGCVVLRDFEANKLFVLEGRCTGSWNFTDPASCLEAARRHQDPAAARPWLDKGCALGYQAACDARASVR